MANIRINSIEVYHPNKVVKNDYYIDHFKQRGRDITHFLEVMGRKERYLSDNNSENGITMAIEASKLVLEKAGMTGMDIDMIIFSTQVPEKTVPTNAMYVHHAINGKKDTIVMDANANCAGMTISIEQASRYMLSNPHVNTALIIGSDHFSLIANPEEEITYANFGDAACAVILEKTNENTGFIDAIYEVDSNYRDNILYPEKGLSHALNGNGSIDYMKWLPFDGSVSLPFTYEKIEKLLKRNHLDIEEINSYCLSQFALSNILKIQERFNIPDQKMIYVGDRYGYTGTSSPFIALYEGIESGRIKRGDLILFWTIGGGHEFITMLFKY
ncbi:ketoacyl-ACP synthase III [Cytobacillus sp. FJAT-53684]|uniref:Ketoacyl-ACP synthase III n=1 Tax=Cytobacillus mangrovibacter TaxID=3299024 RepID=A0ABW6K2E1_9BACI